MKKSKFILFFLLLCAKITFASIPSVQLLSERYRTEWNWVEYRITLKNTSSDIIFNPEIRYYAMGGLLSATVDYSTWLYPVVATIASVDEISIVKLKVNAMLYSGDSVEVHFRIYRDEYQVAFNSSQDWSYQHNENVVEYNYFMPVYDDAHNLLWGYDPLNGTYNADKVLWSDRDVNTVVEKYTGDSAEFVPAGRFWLFKDVPLSPKERELLEQNGIIRYEVGRHQGKNVILFHSDSTVHKAYLDSVLYLFYNAVPANDTSRLILDVPEYVVNDTLPLIVNCWPDVGAGSCIDIVESCGGMNVKYARDDVIAEMIWDSVQCVETHHDVYVISLLENGAPLNDNARAAINLSGIQNTAAFLSAMNESPTTEWLKGVDYTGEGIVVGVYDEGIDFEHPDFQEIDSNGIARKRIIDSLEYFGYMVFDSIKEKMEDSISWHGTGVAGIIGGNGANSANRIYRGIAPKVHYYAGSENPYWQVGHVVNHSHTDGNSDDGLYSRLAYKIDEAIFKNWKKACYGNPLKDCVEGDSLAKTVVYAAGNNGSVHPLYGRQVGYHSVLSNSKNAITVGNITSKEGNRFYHSSMGPTWDGRIKPDVMAPGATSEILANQNHPFEITIDYVKLFRSGATIPYKVLDFYENSLILDLDNLHSSYWRMIANPDASNDNLFQLGVNEPDRASIYNGWKFDGLVNILSTDELEIRFRVSKGSVPDNFMYGSVYFGTHESSFYGPQGASYEYINVVWNVDTNFVTTRVKLDQFPDTLDAYFMRLDFGFVKGVVTPDSCRRDSCGYARLIDGGTSGAAPQVSGLAALMYQKFKKCTGEPLGKKSMRNSTVKSIIIHSAIDMEDSEDAHYSKNPDIFAAHHDSICYFTPYGKGPDFATGWGKIDAKASLETIDNYNSVTKEFPRFKEFEIANGMEKRWKIYVKNNPPKMRATLVWDDYPGRKLTGTFEKSDLLESKLVNDLDLYLVSPSGNFYYPWRLDPLPTDYIDSNGNAWDDYTFGLERIRMQDIHDAYNNCSSSNLLDSTCFDHLNNVEVVDVENPENGIWQVVVRGTRVNYFNNAADDAQIASVVADFELKTSECQIVHDYSAQSRYVCDYYFDSDAANYVTFAESTYVGSGDTIYLYDRSAALLGKYTGSSLAGKKMKISSSNLKVVLNSDNDGVQGWGFEISRIESIPYSILKMPFEFVGGNHN